MNASRQKDPMRPPRGHRARKRYCPICGRRPVFVSHAPRSDGRARTDRQHELCPGCFQRLYDQLRAALRKRREQQSQPPARGRRSNAQQGAGR